MAEPTHISQPQGASPSFSGMDRQQFALLLQHTVPPAFEFDPFATLIYVLMQLMVSPLFPNLALSSGNEHFLGKKLKFTV